MRPVRRYVDSIKKKKFYSKFKFYTQRHESIFFNACFWPKNKVKIRL